MGPIGKIGMNWLLPSLWLFGAVVYAAATLVLTQPFLDGGSASLAAAHETVVAKQSASLRQTLGLKLLFRAGTCH